MILPQASIYYNDGYIPPWMVVLHIGVDIIRVELYFGVGCSSTPMYKTTTCPREGHNNSLGNITVGDRSKIVITLPVLQYCNQLHNHKEAD